MGEGSRRRSNTEYLFCCSDLLAVAQFHDLRDFRHLPCEDDVWEDQ